MNRSQIFKESAASNFTFNSIIATFFCWYFVKLLSPYVFDLYCSALQCTALHFTAKRVPSGLICIPCFAMFAASAQPFESISHQMLLMLVAACEWWTLHVKTNKPCGVWEAHCICKVHHQTNHKISEMQLNCTGFSNQPLAGYHLQSGFRTVAFNGTFLFDRLRSKTGHIFAQSRNRAIFLT